MTETRIALVRNEVDELLQKQRFLAAAESVDSNLAKGDKRQKAEHAVRRDLMIRIHREAVKAAHDDAKRIRERFGDELSGPFSDFLEKVDPADPSIILI